MESWVHPLTSAISNFGSYNFCFLSSSKNIGRSAPVCISSWTLVLTICVSFADFKSERRQVRQIMLRDENKRWVFYKQGPFYFSFRWNGKGKIYPKKKPQNILFVSKQCYIATILHHSTKAGIQGNESKRPCGDKGLPWGVGLRTAGRPHRLEDSKGQDDAAQVGVRPRVL